MSFDSISKLDLGFLLLQAISIQDKPFIDVLFEKTDIKDFYILPKEINNDYTALTSYLLQKIKGGEGVSWIIYANKKMPELDPSRTHWPIGFFSVEYSERYSTALINFALLPSCRKQGIMKLVCEHVFNELSDLGIDTVVAEASMTNDSATRLAIKLDFDVIKTNTSTNIDIGSGTLGLTINYLCQKSL